MCASGPRRTATRATALGTGLAATVGACAPSTGTGRVTTRGSERSGAATTRGVAARPTALVVRGRAIARGTASTPVATRPPTAVEGRRAPAARGWRRRGAREATTRRDRSSARRPAATGGTFATACAAATATPPGACGTANGATRGPRTSTPTATCTTPGVTGAGALGRPSGGRGPAVARGATQAPTPRRPVAGGAPVGATAAPRGATPTRPAAVGGRRGAERTTHRPTPTTRSDARGTTDQDTVASTSRSKVHSFHQTHVLPCE